MTKKLLQFSALLVMLLVFTGFLHWLFLSATERIPDLRLLMISYWVNFLMAGLIYWAMLYLALKQNKYLGFIFLWGSALKFAVYFVVLQPIYLQDGGVSRAEFFYFFIPYLIALIAETAAVVKLLKIQEKAGD